MDKSLVFYENNSFKKNFESKKKFIFFKGDIYDIYKGAIYNPPFFKNFIFENPKTEKDVFIAWNLTLINGYLILPKSSKNFLKDQTFVIKKIKNKEYCVYHKLNNKIYIIYDKYRSLDFSIIGVEKGGTTSLLSNLSKHPDIYMAKPKTHPGGEMHYFNYQITKLNRNGKWFQSQFDYSYKIVGAKNPNHIYLDFMHQYLSHFNPFLKMILVLRNPIDRAYSEWHMFNKSSKFVKNSGNFKTFEEAINDELDNRLKEPPNFYVANFHHLQRGLYYKQIKKLLHHFPMQNLLIILNEDLKNNEKNTYEKIYQFLDVNIKHCNYEIKLEGKYNKNQKEKDIHPKLRKKMIDFFKNDVKKLEKLLNIKTNWF